jgi:hypothetical protein
MQRTIVNVGWNSIDVGSVNYDVAPLCLLLVPDEMFRAFLDTNVVHAANCGRQGEIREVRLRSEDRPVAATWGWGPLDLLTVCE